MAGKAEKMFMGFSFGCKDKIDSLHFSHQLLLYEKDVRLDEKDVRLKQIQNITEILSKKLESTEGRLVEEWIFTKVIVAMALVVFLAMVLLMLLLLTGRDKYTRRLETQIAKYEGMIEEKDHRIKELEKQQAETPQAKQYIQQQAHTVAPFLYALPAGPNTCTKANGNM